MQLLQLLFGNAPASSSSISRCSGFCDNLKQLADCRGFKRA